MALKDAMNRLKGVMDKANPTNMVLSMATSHLPKLVQHLDDMNQPAEDGGKLKGKTERIVYLLTSHGEKPILSTCGLHTNEAGETVLTPLSNISLTDLLKSNFDGTDEETGENA